MVISPKLWNAIMALVTISECLLGPSSSFIWSSLDGFSMAFVLCGFLAYRGRLSRSLFWSCFYRSAILGVGSPFGVEDTAVTFPGSKRLHDGAAQGGGQGSH